MMYRISSVMVLVVVILVSASAITAGERIPLPEDLYYYEPAASVFGPEAIWTNPAALARYSAQSWQLMADYSTNQFAKSYAAVSTGEKIGVGYRHIDVPNDRNFNEYLFAFGGSFGQQHYVGMSYRYFKDGPGLYNKRHFWTIGAVNHIGGPFGWAVLFSNLNRGRIEGERSETEQRYSLSYRAIPDKLTVSADMLLSTKTRLSNADFAYHVEFVPTPGLYVSAYYDSDNRIQIGAKANLLRYFTGAEVRTDKSGHDRGTTVYVGSTTSRQPTLIREKSTRLNMSVGGTVPENPARPFFGRSRDSFADLLFAIYRAADDPMIAEMALSLKPSSLGFGRADEIREALKYFRRKGKQVVCHISYPDNTGYYIGSAADKIYVAPVSQLNLVGLRAELKFYAGTLEKLGVNFDMMRIGEYKTAPERFTEKSATEPNREQINRLLDNMFGQFVSRIAEGRHLSYDSALTLIDNGPYTSEEAVAAGLVDGLSYLDKLHEGTLSAMPEVSFRKYVTDTVTNDNWQPKPVIAVVVAEGEIGPSNDSSNPLDRATGASPSGLHAAFVQAKSNPDVRGIVMRINSPGGWALAAEEIYHEADLAGEQLPLVVSMANVAASGGYQIAMPAAKLYANPTTITGSIGIYGGKLDLSRLYEKIEIGTELYTRGRFAGMLSDTRPFTDEERTKYYSQLEAYYHHFIELVANNRSLSPDSIDALARGRVWTGQEALNCGLIDELGNLQDAVDDLASELNLEDYRVELYPKRRPWFIFPARPLFGLLASAIGLSEDDFTAANELLDFNGKEGEIMARLPYDLTIE